MRIKKMLNDTLHGLMRRRIMHAYRRKSMAVEKEHPEFFRPVNPELSRRHRELWSRMGQTSGDRWLRLHVNLTGIEDYTFCPEDIFFAVIERIMNDCNQSGCGSEDKGALFRFVPKGCEPETVVRFVRGSFFDGDLNWINRGNAAKRLNGEFVGKPCCASGGYGVELRNDFTPEWIERNGGGGYLVQRKIGQCEFAAQFNPASINTIRMMTMRCPWNGEIVVCRSMLRMGVTDVVVDNMMKGGLCVCVDEKGRLGSFAYDYNGKRFGTHPTSGLVFHGLQYPGFAKMVETAKAIHSRILDYNLLSFDLVQRSDGSICVVEINATSEGITQLQYDFGGLFGGYTEDVVNWCAEHKKLDCFAHVRTWY